MYDVIVNEYDIVIFEVRVSGNLFFELEWFKNVVDIIESDCILLMKYEDGWFMFNILDCEDDDIGEYCCVV